MRLVLASLLFVSVVSYAGFRSSAPPTVGGSGGVGDFMKDGSVAMTGDLLLNAQKDVRFKDADSTNYVAIQSPATVGADVTLTLPDNDGDANQVLQTNGSGVLTWSNQGVYPKAWASCTATSSFVANATTTCKYRCSAVNTIDLVLKVTLSGATDAGTTLQFAMPSSPSMTINKTAMMAGDWDLGVGNGVSKDTGNKIWASTCVIGDTTSSLYVYDDAAGGQVSDTVPFSWGNTDVGTCTIQNLQINETCS